MFNHLLLWLICLSQDAWQDVTLYGETDAYIVVYSVTDKETFDEAVDVLYEIRKSPDRSNTAIILVANKNDMVRNRDVTIEGSSLSPCISFWLLFILSKVRKICVILKFGSHYPLMSTEMKISTSAIMKNYKIGCQMVTTVSNPTIVGQAVHSFTEM